MQEIRFLDVNDDEKKLLLDILGFEVSEDMVIIEKKTKTPYICPITKKKVRLEDASILPGSTIIINTSAITLSEYFSRFLEKKGD